MAGRDKKSVMIKKEIVQTHDESASVDPLKKDIANNKNKKNKVIKKQILSNKKRNSNSASSNHMKRNSEVVNNSDNSNLVGQIKKSNNIRKARPFKSDQGSPLSRNGTRSSSQTIRLLRNGKKRQLEDSKDLNDFENIQKKKRKLLPVKTEKINNEMPSDDNPSSSINENENCSDVNNDTTIISNGKNCPIDNTELEQKIDLKLKEDETINSNSEPSHIDEMDLNLKDEKDILGTTKDSCDVIEKKETKEEILTMINTEIEIGTNNIDDKKCIKTLVHDINELTKYNMEDSTTTAKNEECKDFLEISTIENDLSDVEQYDISQEFSIKIDSVLCDTVLKGESISLSHNDFIDNNNLLSENSVETTQVRRSTRSSIDKTRAALTKCFTTARSTGKTNKGDKPNANDTQETVKPPSSNTASPNLTNVKSPISSPVLDSSEENVNVLTVVSTVTKDIDTAKVETDKINEQEENISQSNSKVNGIPSSLDFATQSIINSQEKNPTVNGKIDSTISSSTPSELKDSSNNSEIMPVEEIPTKLSLASTSPIQSVIEPPPTIQDSPTTLNLPRPTPLSPQCTSTPNTIIPPPILPEQETNQIKDFVICELTKIQDAEESTKNVLASIDVAKFYNTENISRVNGEMNGVIDNNDSEFAKIESKLPEEEIVQNPISNNDKDELMEIDQVVAPETESNTNNNSEIIAATNNVSSEIPEDIVGKEIILKALGLQSLKDAAETKAALLSNRSKLEGNYTGTLKTIIKLHKSPERKKKSLKLVLKQDRSEDQEQDDQIKYSISKEAGDEIDEVNLNNNTEDINNSELSPENDESKSKQFLLIIPEKSSSFSIHPGRLCSDVCSYCFGKFGSLDTPCHIAQLKSVDRQQKILEIETHLTADSCLCDACIRHVDRKANCPSYKENKKRHQMKTNQCSALGCLKSAQHYIRRKWLIKLKRSIAKKVPLDSDKLPQNLPIPLCEDHYNWVDYYMVCGICKRRLSRNHMNALGADVQEINKTLAQDGIPVRLTDKMFLCKLCRYYSTLRIKHSHNVKLTGSNKMFIHAYKKRILCFHDIEIDAGSDESTSNSKTKKKRKRKGNDHSNQTKDNNTVAAISSQPKLDDNQQSTSTQPDKQKELQNEMTSNESSSPIVDIESLTEISIMKKPPTSIKVKTTTSNSTTTSSSSSSSSSSTSSVSHPIFRTVGNGNGGTVILLEQNPLRNPMDDVVNRPFYPGLDQLPLEANLEFPNTNIEDKYVNQNWDKCTATIQMEKNTKVMYQKLQLPYGNASSFFRHMVLLEKFWRSGDLSLTPSASNEAINYFRSVQTRVRSFEGYPAVSVPVQTQIFPATSTASSKPQNELPFRRAASATYTPTATITSNSSNNTQIITQKRKPVPNLLQMNPDGISFTLMPGTISRPMTTTQSISTTTTMTTTTTTTASNNSNNPISTLTSKSNMVICDVRSLAPQETIERWDQKKFSSIEALTNNPSLSVSIVPAATPTPQSNTVVTPTGIILSRNPEMCISSVTVKKK